VDRYIEPATPRQRILISRLCMALKVKEPLEEGIMTFGQAGKLISSLEGQVRALRGEVTGRRKELDSGRSK